MDTTFKYCDRIKHPRDHVKHSRDRIKHSRDRIKHARDGIKPSRDYVKPSRDGVKHKCAKILIFFKGRKPKHKTINLSFATANNIQ